MANADQIIKKVIILPSLSPVVSYILFLAVFFSLQLEHPMIKIYG